MYREEHAWPSAYSSSSPNTARLKAGSSNSLGHLSSSPLIPSRWRSASSLSKSIPPRCERQRDQFHGWFSVPRYDDPFAVLDGDDEVGEACFRFVQGKFHDQFSLALNWCPQHAPPRACSQGRAFAAWLRLARVTRSRSCTGRYSACSCLEACASQFRSTPSLMALTPLLSAGAVAAEAAAQAGVQQIAHRVTEHVEAVHHHGQTHPRPQRQVRRDLHVLPPLRGSACHPSSERPPAGRSPESSAPPPP